MGIDALEVGADAEGEEEGELKGTDAV